MRNEIDWPAVLQELRSQLREEMKQEAQHNPLDEKNNPHMWRVFEYQEMIGSIEQGNHEEAYRLLSEEYGESFFDDYRP